MIYDLFLFLRLLLRKLSAISLCPLPHHHPRTTSSSFSLRAWHSFLLEVWCLADYPSESEKKSKIAENWTILTPCYGTHPSNNNSGIEFRMHTTTLLYHGTPGGLSVLFFFRSDSILHYSCKSSFY